MHTPADSPAPEDPPLLSRIESLRDLMPRAEALLAQVADYIRAAERTAADLGADGERLRTERSRLQEEREEVEALRRQLLDARSEFEAGAKRQDDELDALRAQLTSVCETLALRERERDSTAAGLRAELEAARARVHELERVGSRTQAEDTVAALSRLRSLEGELLRTREERSRMLAILGLPAVTQQPVLDPLVT